MPDFLAPVALAALVFSLTNFLKYALAGDWIGVRTQIVVWGAGVGGAFLLAQTQWATGLDVGGVSVADMDSWDLIFFGLNYSSLATAFNEYKKARDGSDSAVTPRLTLKKPEQPHSNLEGPDDLSRRLSGVEVDASWEEDQRRMEEMVKTPPKPRKRSTVR